THTFGIVTVAWVFFRADTLGGAGAYLSALLGVAPQRAGATLLGGTLYQPYYLFTMILAGGITWWAPQTWDFTRELTWPKAAWCGAMLILALALLTNQSNNPFNYFIF